MTINELDEFEKKHYLEVDEKARLLQYYHIEQGWSFDLSMYKSGFGKNWHKTEIANHPVVKKLRADAREAYYAKYRKFVK